MMTLSELNQLLRPLASRVTNMVARIVVGRVDDSKKLQVIQLGALADIDDGEHHQPYGFSSVPLAGAEGVAVFPNGDAGVPLVVVVSDRRHRPTGGEPGQVTIYNSAGAKAVFKGVDIELTPGPGGKIIMAGAVTTPGPTSEGILNGQAIDPLTGQTHAALGNASSKVFAKK